ncbi:bifunctional glutamate N-acetyltransferase/amino-acid acetyltransferase ArgJ [Propylenella binzhouense]|uniref:Arginine biosynthesis bifunctional protein ArgJ n=1 Tax=Propylenella binzhouense TaxID=2555902 RepID=A0A964T6R7_9HYPH|nr:bifunctional glutamate N-acetyltransferase/amino-acid acetyltransferase ArgJ [Propylenella binzhouense]MYZ49538.1 bifunctional glutamate N-acetyltransferase/amino-acid acetyltransferase ArgJ [Propylenella binzhouense]
MSAKVSPFAPSAYPALPAVDGVRFASTEAGIRYSNRRDLLLATFVPGTVVAGVFTRSKCPSAPVEWDRDRLAGGRARALVVNSGNANAFTGRKGREATRLTAEAAARAVGCGPDEIFLASTGVIGEPLDPVPFERHLDRLAREAAPDGILDAARAIMTTDTYPKAVTRSVEIAGATVTLNGIAKGAGMIAPDMATMLSFLFTDAAASQATLQAALADAVAESFNAITIDSDTSTSDTVLLFATGTAAARGAPALEEAGAEALEAFRGALASLCRELAHMVVKDGEGATKFVEVRVRGAVSDQSAKRIARAIADSPLVKTALAGEDANWGRVVMAVGKAGEPADRDRLSIWFGDFRVAHEGERDPAYSEAAVSAYMKAPELAITADLGLGDGAARIWTCDLTHDYVAINADYRS